VAAKKSPDLIVVDEMDLVVLGLAQAPLGSERDEAYEDKAELYGDQHLFSTAASLRERGLLGWGSQWNHCWLTDKGQAALATHHKTSDEAKEQAKKMKAA
jgi:hypothetical protein